MQKLIWFIRHGESVTNAGGIWPNTVTNPLTEKGAAQAELIPDALQTEPTLIVTSPYLRTQLTAKPTLEKFPAVKHETWPVQEFTEICHQTRGLLPREEKDKIYATARQNQDYKDGPMAESFNELVARTDLVIDKIESATEEKIFIFSHGFFLGALFFRLKNRDLNPVSSDTVREYKKNMHIPNAAIICCRFNNKGFSELISASIDHLPGEQWSIRCL